jgi:hypothetical protein
VTISTSRAATVDVTRFNSSGEAVANTRFQYDPDETVQVFLDGTFDYIGASNKFGRLLSQETTLFEKGKQYSHTLVTYVDGLQPIELSDGTIAYELWVASVQKFDANKYLIEEDSYASNIHIRKENYYYNSTGTLIGRKCTSPSGSLIEIDTYGPVEIRDYYDGNVLIKKDVISKTEIHTSQYRRNGTKYEELFRNLSGTANVINYYDSTGTLESSYQPSIGTMTHFGANRTIQSIDVIAYVDESNPMVVESSQSFTSLKSTDDFVYALPMRGQAAKDTYKNGVLSTHALYSAMSLASSTLIEIDSFSSTGLLTQRQFYKEGSLQSTSVIS